MQRIVDAKDDAARMPDERSPEPRAAANGRGP